jgi:hypothetical protein
MNLGEALFGFFCAAGFFGYVFAIFTIIDSGKVSKKNAGLSKDVAYWNSRYTATEDRANRMMRTVDAVRDYGLALIASKMRKADPLLMVTRNSVPLQVSLNLARATLERIALESAEPTITFEECSDAEVAKRIEHMPIGKDEEVIP